MCESKLHRVGDPFDLRSKNRTTKLGNMFMGANFPMLGHRLFLNWIRLQRFFSKLPVHFFHCLGFKLRGIFLRLSRLLCIRCLNSFLGCLVHFVSYLDWLLGCPSFFLGY